MMSLPNKMVLTILLLSTACKKEVHIELENGTDLAMASSITATGPRGAEEYSASPSIAAAVDGAATVEPLDLRLPVGSRIDISYHPVGTKGDYVRPTTTVAKKNGNIDVDLELTDVISPSNVTTVFQQLATDMRWSESTRLYQKDAHRKLAGSVILALPTQDGFAEGTPIPVIEVSIPDEDLVTTALQTETSGQLVVNAAANYGGLTEISSKLESNSVYSVSWNFQHFTYKNSDPILQLLLDGPPEVRATIRTALELNPGYGLYYISEMEVLSEGEYTYIKGQSTQVGMNLDVATTFNASGGYTFSHDDQKIVRMSNQVYNVVLLPLADRDKYMSTVRSDGTLKLPHSNKTDVPLLLKADGDQAIRL